MEKEWVEIFSSTDAFQVEIAKQTLDQMEIDSVIINKKGSTYGFGGFDSIELYVHRDNVIRAKQILKDF
jgi:hypothetical protein